MEVGQLVLMRIRARVCALACELVGESTHWLRGCLRSESLPDRPLMVVAVAVAAGCGLPAVVELLPVVWWLTAVVTLLACPLLLWAGRPHWASVAVVVAILGGSAGWSAVRSDFFFVDDLAWSLTSSPQPVAIEGVVVESPRRLTVPLVDPLRSSASQAAMQRPSSECVVAVRAVRRGSRWRPAAGRAALIVDGEPPELTAGCRVRVLGRGIRPPPPLNPAEFDFRTRAQSLRCLSIVRVHSAECVRVISRPTAWSPMVWIDALRDRGVEILRRHISAERAPLAAALLLGSREALPREESLEYLVTGTIHILSISGLHVGFLALALFKVLRILAFTRGWSLLAVAGCTGLYMVLVRAETPVVRATLLIWLTCLGAAVGRRSLAANSLALAAIVVLLIHPPELFRIGSQLSFLSTAVLIGASAALPRAASDDPIERLIQRSRSPLERRLRRIGWQTWGVLVTGAAVWAVTAPVVAARFHLVSPVGLLLNPLIAPLVAVAMAWGFLCLVAATVSATLAAACGWACDATLACIGQLVAWAAALPGGYFWVTGPPGWWVTGWYLLLAATLLLVTRERLVRISTWVTVTAVWMGLGWAGVAVPRLVCPPPPSLRVVVAAMGHGCGIVVRSPTGRCLVYDAGRLGAPSAARRAMTAVLWHEGVTRIDTLVISHADTDPFNAVPELIDRFAVGEIVVPPAFLENDSWSVEELLRQARGAGIPVRSTQAGESFAVDPLCRIRVLHPAAGNVPPQPTRATTSAPAPTPDNETSLVLSVEAAGRRLLLTGDLEGESLARFIASDPDSCDVLVAPHHGSHSSLPPDIARATAADWVIVSGLGASGWPEVREAYATARGNGSRARVMKTGPTAPASPTAGPPEDSSGGAIALTFTAACVRVEQFNDGTWRACPLQAAEDLPASGRVRAQPTVRKSNWLATNPASSMSTPLVKP